MSSWQSSSCRSERWQKNKGHLPSAADLPPLLRHPVSNTIFHFIRADKWQRHWPIRQQTVQNRPALPSKHTLESIRGAFEITPIPSKPIKHTIEECSATATHLVSTGALWKMEKQPGTGEQRLGLRNRRNREMVPFAWMTGGSWRTPPRLQASLGSISEIILLETRSKPRVWSQHYLGCVAVVVLQMKMSRWWTAGPKGSATQLERPVRGHSEPLHSTKLPSKNTCTNNCCFCFFSLSFSERCLVFCRNSEGD